MSFPQSRLQLSDRLYRKFLVAYSSEYRQKYGDEMAQVFRDLCLEIYHERGAAGLMVLWTSTLLDLFKTAIEDRWNTLPFPASHALVPIGSWAAIIAGLLSILFAFTHASPNHIDWVFRLKWVWPALGMLYLVALIGFGAKLMELSQSVGVGLIVALAGALVMFVAGFLIYSVSRIWISFRDGLLIVSVGIILMALFPRGSSYPRPLRILILTLGIFAMLTTLFVPAGYMGYLFDWDTTLFASLMGLCWIALGMIMLTGRLRVDAAQKKEKEK